MTAETATAAPAGEEAPVRWPVAVAAAATALVTGLVLFQLGDKSLWYDEAFSIGIVDRPFGDALWRMAHWEVNQSPFYLLLAGWWRVGQGETFLRLLPAVFAVLAVPAMFLLGRRLLGAPAGAVAALVLACHPLAVQWGQQLRGYSLVLLLTITAVLQVLRALDRPESATRASAAAALAALATYGHFFAGLVVVAVAVWLLLQRPVPTRLLVRAGVVYAVLVAPLAAFLVTREGDPLYWLGDRSTWDAVVDTSVDLAGGTRWGLVPYAAAAGAGLWAAVRAVRRHPASRSSGAVLAAVWFALPVGVVLASTLTVKPLLEGRFLIVVLPALALLAAAGVVRLRPAPAAAVLGVLVLAAALGLQNWYTTPSHEDWRGATELVAASVGPERHVVVEPWRGVFALRYYEERLDIDPHDVLRPGLFDPPAGDRLVEVQVLSGEGTSPRMDAAYVAWRDEYYEPRSAEQLEGLAVRTYQRR